MQSIMQNLLSKEVLYPSLKEITAKVGFSTRFFSPGVPPQSVTFKCVPSPPPQYPEWLDANKPNLSPEDFQRYEQQAKLMGEICKQFEKEDQGAEEKESTFESIMDLMQKVDNTLQTCWLVL